MYIYSSEICNLTGVDVTIGSENTSRVTDFGFEPQKKENYSRNKISEKMRALRKKK